MQPLFGALWDRWGRKKSTIAFGLLLPIVVVPLMTALAHVDSPGTAFRHLRHDLPIGPREVDGRVHSL